MPKQIESMTTENKNGNKKSTDVYYERFWNLKKLKLLLSMPLALFIEYSWFVVL